LLLEPASTVARLNPLSLIAEGLRGPIIGDLQMAAVAKALAGIAIVAAVGTALTAYTLRRRTQRG
jgi:ABC-type polysaccharide/polyol phosphate export permease